MAISITHATAATLADDPSAEIGSDEWNEAHDTSGIQNELLNLFIGPFSPYDIASSGTSIGFTANRCILQAFQVNRAVTVTKARIIVADAQDNIDIGIYNAAGTRLGSTGATAMPATGALRDINLTGSVALSPATLYYAAVAHDTGNGSMLGRGPTFAASYAFGGLDTPLSTLVSSSYPLPSTITIGTSGNVDIYAVWFG